MTAAALLPARRHYEVRDPVHGFVLFNVLERDLLNSTPLQRLRAIKQLALTGQVYPGALHTRLEHSLGVMELARPAFDIVSAEPAPSVQEALEWTDQRERQRQIVRLAGLLHDVGHTPFSHGAEERCPPERPSHEHYTRDLVADPRGEIRQIIEGDGHYRLGIRVDDILPVAVPDLVPPRRAFHTILAALVAGELGVDRMDYLVRDSHHAGVTYGRFRELRSGAASLAEFQVVDYDRVRPIAELSDAFLTIRPAWAGRIYCDPADPTLRQNVRAYCLERLPVIDAGDEIGR